MFISTVLSLPVIINCCVLVVRKGMTGFYCMFVFQGIWLCESISLLKICIKQMKRARIEQNNRIEIDKKKKKE
jgi:hypothetical protein